MGKNIKFKVEFISVEKDRVNLQYTSAEKVTVKTMRLHCMPYEGCKPENSIFRKDDIQGKFNFQIPIRDKNVSGITFVVKDETHKEQYSIAIKFSTKSVNIKEMMYEA